MRKRLTPTQAAKMLNKQANPVGRIKGRISRYEQFLNELLDSGKLTEEGRARVLELQSWIQSDREELQKYEK